MASQLLTSLMMKQTHCLNLWIHYSSYFRVFSKLKEEVEEPLLGFLTVVLLPHRNMI